MVADTLRQKFIYATPFNKYEFPLVALDGDVNSLSTDIFKIDASSLYFLEKDRFDLLICKIKDKYDSVLILNDYDFRSSNIILIKGALCHMLAFAYLFKQNGLKCNII